MTLPSKNHPSLLIASVIVGCLCALLIGSFIWGAHISQTYDQKILPNVSVVGIPLGGLSEDKANQTLRSELGQTKVTTVPVQIKDQIYTLKADAETEGNSFVEPSTTLAHKAFLIGRSQNPFRNTFDRVRLSLGGKSQVPLSVDVDAERLEKSLRPKISALLAPATNAALAIDPTTHAVTITPEKGGVTIDWTTAARLVREHINRRETKPVQIPLNEASPDLTTNDLNDVRTQAETWIAKPTITLIATSSFNGTWAVTSSTIANWITVTSNEPHSAQLTFDQARVQATLQGWLGTNARAAQNGLLELDEQGKLKTFIAPKEGLGPDTSKTLQNLLSAWDTQTTSTEFSVQIQKPTIGGDAERLGIRELLGRGTSEFAGSPSNRRKNIKLGMERVHGTILPPGSEFSMLNTLGEIDGAHGWLPELVIKGNQTLPEFGGGLCQIGTTAFRGAMNTGLEITERRNHSYRVRYYEPAGTDATIYDPSPDFKFKNDTANTILITGEIRGDIVEFAFWGTSDGRKGTIGPSRITKIVSPPPTKIVETTTLAPGVKKCTETAHAGATAQVDYSIQYADGQSKVVTFTSVYRPWQAVCLVGVTTLTPPDVAAAADVDQTGINNLN